MWLALCNVNDYLSELGAGADQDRERKIAQLCQDLNDVCVSSFPTPLSYLAYFERLPRILHAHKISFDYSRQAESIIAVLQAMQNVEAVIRNKVAEWRTKIATRNSRGFVRLWRNRSPMTS